MARPNRAISCLKRKNIDSYCQVQEIAARLAYLNGKLSADAGKPQMLERWTEYKNLIKDLEKAKDTAAITTKETKETRGTTALETRAKTLPTRAQKVTFEDTCRL